MKNGLCPTLGGRDAYKKYTKKVLVIRYTCFMEYIMAMFIACIIINVTFLRRDNNRCIHIQHNTNCLYCGWDEKYNTK